MTLTKLAASAAALALLAGTASADTMGCDDGEIVVKFSHVTNTDRHPKGIAASLLMERVNAEMDGTMCVEVFPNSTLYNDDQVLEAILQGDVQLAAPSLSKFEVFTKQFRIFDLPFMFESIDAVDAFQISDTGQAMKDSMQRRGLQGLEFWHNGMKQLSANVALESPSDAAGLKFRVQTSDVLVAQMEALGASPQPMAFSEVQDGVTETNHGVLDYLVVASVDFLDSLEADTRDQFLGIMREVTETRNSESSSVNAAARQSVIDAGGIVRQLSDEQRADWVAAMKPVWEKFVEDVGQDNIDAAQAINDSL